MSSFEIDFGESERVVGIDLGTTNSLVAYMDLTGPKIIPVPTEPRASASGPQHLVPSIVSVTDSGDIVVGAPARELLLTHPDRTVYSVKRLMGRGRQDVQEELKLFPFRIAEGSVKPSQAASPPARPCCK